MKLRSLITLGAASLLLLATACGGDKEPSSSDSGATRSSSGAAAVAAPLDLSASANNLLETRSFRFDFSMKMELPDLAPTSAEDDPFGAAFGAALLGLFSDIRAEGAFVSPDSTEVKMTMMGQEIGFVQIGQDAWVKYGAGWEKTDADESLTMGFTSPADLFTEFLPQEVLKGAKTTKEKVNGVDAVRYSFDKAAIEKLAMEAGETPAEMEELTEANLDVWLTGENIPVKVVLNAAGKDEDGAAVGMKLEMNIKDLNSDSIRIRPPV
jgi:hypothetical protein